MSNGYEILGRLVDGILAPLKAWWFWLFVALLIGLVKGDEIIAGIKAAGAKLP